MMYIAKVSNEDGKRCANLISFLSKGRWDLLGSDAEELVRVKQWLHGVAMQMASDLKATEAAAAVPSPAPSASTFKVKKITQGSAPKSSSKKK